jgi:hypothetical protein
MADTFLDYTPNAGIAICICAPNAIFALEVNLIIISLKG